MFSEAHVEADGFRIRYLVAGEGEPLVCLHGAGGLRVSRALELLSAKYKVFALEMPGFGVSPVNDRTAGTEDMARTVAAAARALGLEKFNLWGNSFGAKIAMQLTVMNPDMVRTLILVSPAAIRTTPRPVQGEPTPDLLYAQPEKHTIAPVSPEISAKQRALVQRLGGPPRDEAFEASIKGLETPTLILFGTRDRMTPPENGRIYRQLMPKSSLMMIYDAAHAVDADRPEAVAEVVGDYIDRHDSFLVTRQNGMIHP